MRMMVMGLTGGIASGKSTLAAHMRTHYIAVFDADAAVHRLMRDDELVRLQILSVFPEANRGGEIDRQALGAAVFADAARLVDLEKILHPIVRAQEEAFIDTQKKTGAKACMLEIPLLFETAADTLCDMVVVASASEAVRKERAFARAGMTEQKWVRIVARQLPEDVRARRADAVVDTSKDVGHAITQLDALLKQIGVM